MEASKVGNSEIAQLLIDKGAVTNLTNYVSRLTTTKCWPHTIHVCENELSEDVVAGRLDCTNGSSS